MSKLKGIIGNNNNINNEVVFLRLRSEMKNVRVKNNLTVKQVADTMGVSVETVNKMESYNPPHDMSLNELSDYLNAIGAKMEIRIR